MKRTLLLCSFLVAGCATTMPEQPTAQKGAESAGDPVTDAHTDPDRDNPPSPKNKVSKQPSSERQPTPGAIPRAELTKVLDASPGYFLQRVQTEPRFSKGRFAGWRVVSFFPGDARFAGVDLQAGDVITRVNGKPIEKPDQFMVVWGELRSSKELVVDVERAGAPRTLRWTIADK
jgi:type II secretory pathway component PulC